MSFIMNGLPFTADANYRTERLSCPDLDPFLYGVPSKEAIQDES
jgi:hypothetical protein